MRQLWKYPFSYPLGRRRHYLLFGMSPQNIRGNRHSWWCRMSVLPPDERSEGSVLSLLQWCWTAIQHRWGVCGNWYNTQEVRLLIIGGRALFEILCTILFVWLFIKVFGLVFKVAWSLTKVLATIFFVTALPALIVCFIFAGGILLLLPVGLLGLAFALLSA